MAIDEFKDIDICNIIKTCFRSGVKTLEFGPLKINFESELPGFVSPSRLSRGSTDVKSLELSDSDHELLSELAETQTMMDDPVQWEANIIDGYMEHSGVRDARTEHNEA